MIAFKSSDLAGRFDSVHDGELDVHLRGTTQRVRSERQ